MTLGEKIKKIRLSKNLTLDDMANRLGYSNRSAFYKIENGYVYIGNDDSSTTCDVVIIYEI